LKERVANYKTPTTKERIKRFNNTKYRKRRFSALSVKRQKIGFIGLKKAKKRSKEDV